MNKSAHSNVFLLEEYTVTPTRFYINALQIFKVRYMLAPFKYVKNHKPVQKKYV